MVLGTRASVEPNGGNSLKEIFKTAMRLDHLMFGMNIENDRERVIFREVCLCEVTMWVNSDFSRIAAS